jgi:acyl-CoA thioester hydrolase
MGDGGRHVERLRVAWVDTDAGGRIHFTAAFRYAEHAETALMRELGLVDRLVDYPRRRVEADFRAVLRFDDEVSVEIRADRIGTTSITWAWEISRGDEVCIEGRHTAVHVGADGRPAPLPDDVRERLAAFAPER